ncbi:hypothetical protein BGW42_008432 [Actinomortierella wolfii]|nr:hypothetical protein BGW42_008432 [Actinomortierella wolfii]
MDKIMRNFLSRHKQWAQEGWSGYAFNFYKIVQILTINYYLPNGDLAKVQASINDFLSYARSFLGVIVIQNSVETLPSFQEAFPTLLDLSVKRVGMNYLAGNRMIPKTMFDSEEGIDRLATALKQAKDDMYHTNSLIGAVIIFADASHVSEAVARETSVQPAWRSTLMIPTVFALWSDGISAKDEMNIKRSLTKAIGRLRAITPGFGTYINEANPDEPDWQESFFSANYPRLLEIKRKYDPHGLFVCRKCVGSEDWDDDLMCRTTNTSNIMT